MRPLDNFLNDTEKFAIQAFMDNEVQREAVKKVLLFELYENGTLKTGKAATPLRNAALGLAAIMDDPAKMGQRLMAMWEGINFLESGFKQLSLYAKKQGTAEPKENPAL